MDDQAPRNGQPDPGDTPADHVPDAPAAGETAADAPPADPPADPPAADETAPIAARPPADDDRTVLAPPGPDATATPHTTATPDRPDTTTSAPDSPASSPTAAPAPPATTVIPQQAPATPAAPAGVVPPGGPTPVEAPAGRSRPGITGALTAVGVGLLAAAVVLSASRSRSDGDLDWSNYSVGLGATAALLLVALAATGLVRRRTNPTGREQLVTWPGTMGILGVALMIVVGLEDQTSLDDVLAYIVGGVVVGLSVLGYLASRRAAFVVTAILGLGVIYGQVFDDVFSDIGGEDDGYIIVAVAIAVFIVGVTVLGWALPTRATSGVVVAVWGVVAYAALLTFMAVYQAIGAWFGGFSMPGATEGAPSDVMPTEGSGVPDFDNDVWIILALAAGLTVLWALAAAWTDHSGFTLSAIAMPVATVPLATVVLAVEHPTWWGVALAGAGAVLLLGGGLLGRLRGRRTSTA